MEQALIDYMLASGSPVLAAVSTRVHWNLSPQATAFPRIVMTVIGRSPIYADEGETGLFESRVQIDAYATTWRGAMIVAEAVRTRLSGLKTATGGVTFETVTIEDERHFFELGQGNAQLHRVSIDFIVWHRS